jgi:hypothetical protein
LELCDTSACNGWFVSSSNHSKLGFDQKLGAQIAATGCG